MAKQQGGRLFEPHEMAQLAKKVGEAEKQARWIPLRASFIGVLGLNQFVLGFVEYELAFQIFDYVASDESYWSPHVMAFTGILMIIAFHVIASENPDHVAVRWVGRIAGLLIPVYAIGLGLLLAAILFSDGLSGMISVPGEFSLTVQEVTEAARGNWLEWLFEQVTNPLAITVFALAVGGLAVVNLHLSHHLINRIARGVTDLYYRHTRLTEVLDGYAVVQRSQRRYQELAHERETIARIDDEALATELATDTLAVMQEALSPHKCLLKDLEYAPDPSRLVIPEYLPPNPKQLARDIAKIDAVGVEEILKVLGVQENVRRSKK